MCRVLRIFCNGCKLATIRAQQAIALSYVSPEKESLYQRANATIPMCINSTGEFAAGPMTVLGSYATIVKGMPNVE